MQKLHFDAQGKGLMWTLNPECGQANAKVTTDPKAVTCKRCRKSAAWRNADREARGLPLLAGGEK